MISRHSTYCSCWTLSLLIMLLAIPAVAWSQTPADSIKGKGAKGFNALRHSLQGSFRGKNYSFENKRWFDNLYITTGGATEAFMNTNLDLDQGWGYNVGVGKYLSRHHSVRMTFDMMRNQRTLGSSLQRYGGSVAHLFNITSTMFGYNPNRRMEVSTIEGLGYVRSSIDDEVRHGYRGFLGLQFKFHAAPNFDVSVEPLVAANSRQATLAERTDRGYSLSYGLGANLRYFFHDRSFVPSAEINHLVYGFFFSASIGAQMQLSDLSGSEVGPSASLSVGRWIVPGFGMRLTGTMATDTWHLAEYPAESEISKAGYRRYENTSYLSGRGELVFEPFVFFKRYDEENKFQMKLSAGVEAGWLSKENYDAPVRKGFYGFTGGIQFGYRWDEDKLIYLEPRFTQARYRMGYEHLNAYRSFADNLLSLNLGFEVDSPILTRRGINEAMRPYFRQQFLLALEGGINHPIQSRRYNDRAYIDYQVGLLAQYLLTPLQGVGLHLDANRVSMDVYNGHQQFNTASAALQYRFDATSAILGYYPGRKVTLHLFAGPVATALRRSGETRFEFGAEAGFSVRYNFKEYFGIYLAPQIRLYPSDFLPNELSGWDKVCSAMAGISFKL